MRTLYLRASTSRRLPPMSKRLPSLDESPTHERVMSRTATFRRRSANDRKPTPQYVYCSFPIRIGISLSTSSLRLVSTSWRALRSIPAHGLVRRDNVSILLMQKHKDIAVQFSILLDVSVGVVRKILLLVLVQRPHSKRSAHKRHSVNNLSHCFIACASTGAFELWPCRPAVTSV